MRDEHDWSPREHDHHVEPMFGGLGVGPGSGREEPAGGAWMRFVRWVRGFFAG